LTYYDGRGRSISLNKGDYYFKIVIADGPIDSESCGGIFDKNPSDEYWKYSIDDVEVWRLKAEQVDAFYFINVISPLELYTEPIVNEYGENWGDFTCNLFINNNYGVKISYIFPDNKSPEIFSEMDDILRSLTWKK